MALSHSAAVRELVSIEPDEAGGPWTVFCPASPNHGDYWTLRAKNTSSTTVTIDGNGKDIVSVHLATTASSHTVALNGQCLDFMFDSVMDAWVIRNGYTPSTI